MNMIGHETVRENINVVFLCVLTQPFQIGNPIAVGKEDVLTAIAPLCDVMGHAGADGSRQARHQ